MDVAEAVLILAQAPVRRRNATVDPGHITRM
jgi:hypothetical protein